MSDTVFPAALKVFQQKYPRTFATQNVEQLLSPNLISPRVIELPRLILEQAKLVFKNIFLISKTEDFKSFALKNSPFNPQLGSLLTSFDFHWDGEFLKLIEINTNASSYLVSDLIYELHQVNDFNDRLEKLAQDFAICVGDGKKIFILDEFPEKENLYIEFFMYKEFLENKGYEVKIISLAEFENLKNSEMPDLIYNRYCDFYLEEPKSLKLKTHYESGQLKLSPHPYFYNLLANKKRFLTFCNPNLKQKLSPELKLTIDNHILNTVTLNNESSDEIWQSRKQYFIKPSLSYGGKSAYRGESISRKRFDELIAEQAFIAQKFVPAPEMSVDTPEGKQNFKYDLRFYGFEGEVQFAIARLYQGQITNMRNPHGGLTPIHFV